MSDRFHRAARDGALGLLKEATRKDCNTKDVDGMTPTLWATFEGNLEALRLLVGRGGDPEKCDNYGNTALHIAAARGHLNCVTFLVNFKVNLWAMDIDFHTAKDLAAMNDRQEILRYLDEAITKQERSDPRTVKSLKEKATKDAQKRSKDFKKIQEKAAKLAAQEQDLLKKEREKMEKQGNKAANSAAASNSAIPRPSMAALTLRKDSVQLYGQSHKFSDMVGTQGSTQRKVPAGAVSKKVLQQMKLKKSGKNSVGSVKSNSTNAINEVGEGDFKVGAIESDGKRSVRSISGLVRDSEVMYVPKFDSNPNAKRGKLSGIFNGSSEDVNGESNGLSRSISHPDYLNDVDDQVPAFQKPRGSIFERPGFGSMAFRNSITAALSTLPAQDDGFSSKNGSSGRAEDSIGSASSLKNRNRSWDRDELDSDGEEDEEENGTPLHFFLAAAGLPDYVDVFVKEDIDLDALMLLTDSDLQSLGLQLGPRRKLLKAILDRKAAFEDPGEMEDSHL